MSTPSDGSENVALNLAEFCQEIHKIIEPYEYLLYMKPQKQLFFTVPPPQVFPSHIILYES